MKKIVSLVLTIVLMASMFAMLGTITASAETYEITNELVNLTFDGEARYGFPVARVGGVAYNDGYVTLTSLNQSNNSMYIGKDGTVGATVVARSNTDDVTKFTSAQTEAYNNLFIFEANKTYTVSYDYKVLKDSVSKLASGTSYTLKKAPGVMLMHNPMLSSADSNRSISRVSMISSSVPDITWTKDDLVVDEETGNEVLKADTEWASCHYTFTVKADDPGFAWGIHDGAGNGLDTYMSYDNIVIKEVLGSYDYSDSGVYTMDEDGLTWNNSSSAPGEIVNNYDAEHGSVLKVSGSANTSRGGLTDSSLYVTKGNKYYITFDAKADKEGNLVTCFTNLTATTTARHFFSGYNIRYGGVKYYVNGVEKVVTDKSTNADVFPVTTEWATYSLVVDTASDVFNTALEGSGTAGYAAHFWNQNPISFGFAANVTAYFDNLKIVAVEEVDSVVPEKDESAKYSIRETAAGTTAGLRFRGSVANTVKEAADEIGFVVAPVSLVGGNDNWYKLDSLSVAAKKAVAYDGTKDVIYSSDAETTSYQLILTKLDNIVVHRFAAVMYVKTGNTYEYISLGEISYNQVLAEYAVRGK